MRKKPVVTYKNKSGVITTLCGNDAVVWLLADLEKRMVVLESIQNISVPPDAQ